HGCRFVTIDVRFELSSPSLPAMLTEHAFLCAPADSFHFRFTHFCEIADHVPSGIGKKNFLTRREERLQSRPAIRCNCRTATGSFKQTHGGRVAGCDHFLPR